jgi:hypothetical protein
MCILTSDPNERIRIKSIGAIFGLVRKKAVIMWLIESYIKYYYCDHIKKISETRIRLGRD